MNMEEVNYKVSEVGLDTRSINYDCDFLGDGFNKISYLFTSISANNDFLVGPDLRVSSKFSIITHIDTVDKLEYLVEAHTKSLGVRYLSVLLIDSECDISSKEIEINNLKERGLVESIGIYGPKSKEVLEKTKIPFDYVGLPVSPLDYNHEVMEWCKSNEKTVIGLEPYGDKLSEARNIESFTKMYLLNFISTNADIVILPGKDLVQAIVESEYVMNLKGTKSLPMYVLKKSWHKTVEPLNKFAYTSVVLGDGVEISYHDPEMLIDSAEITLGAAKETKFADNTKKALQKFDVDEELRKSSDPVSTINDLVSGVLDYSGLSDEVAFAFARYRVLSRLQDFFPGDDWEVQLAKIGTSELTIRLTKPEIIKGMLWWTKVTPAESKTYVLAMNKRRFKFFELDKNVG